ncbi:glucokinase [Propionigenium maris DSM 9537]|uniref:Glucokinase n=1 Tax=Propionigenium maris DSM 9537 TaxID=1123000 RepID=A0A9W6LNS1_9FUSO|nr:ROK family protein [Propionigenium maris]GLI57199.1 glucokinase [Propionigenium maris DSM 9537]
MRYYAGVDLGGTNTKIGIIGEDGEILVRNSIKTNSHEGVEVTMTRIWQETVRLCTESNIPSDSLAGIGIGIPGPVMDQEVVGFFANFPWEANINLAELMKRISKVETKLENDVNVIAMGESKFGAGKGSRTAITVALGTGVGGGIVVDGRLISGVAGAGGEIGHMKLVDNGKICGCGQRGCFEAYASATGIIREAVSRLAVNKQNMLFERIEGRIEELEAKDIFDCAKAGDEFSVDIVEYASKYLAMGIGNLLNIINPERIILSGGVALAGDILLDNVREKLKNYAMPVTLKGMEIVQGTLGNDAGIKGSIALFI